MGSAALDFLSSHFIMGSPSSLAHSRSLSDVQCEATPPQTNYDTEHMHICIQEKEKTRAPGWLSQ